MASHYDVTLGQNIPHGTSILNAPCKVVFTYPDGSRSGEYSATVFAWRLQNVVGISSSYMNIEAAWQGANGGTLSIQTVGGTVSHPITGFTRT
ncbi:hypothetical protein [Polyangium aurulentum]|uniref:hypothetical protein n=1 Tax=Polyangium aurulentum TaxID=2567896 RepID=UPI0010ADD56F|nr:hypothetical protein [Polyangium aurulentum]UQA55474.1 hypothetical protein E8A73_029520 [Polyangium aurulentum]